MKWLFCRLKILFQKQPAKTQKLQFFAKLYTDSSLKNPFFCRKRSKKLPTTNSFKFSKISQHLKKKHLGFSTCLFDMLIHGCLHPPINLWGFSWRESNLELVQNTGWLSLSAPQNVKFRSIQNSL